MRKLLYSIVGGIIMALLGACSATKFIPEGEYMLESVSVKSTDKSLDVASLKGYIRQHPNSKWFSLLKVPMGPYALSGRDTTKRINRFLQRVGEAPVIFDTVQANRSGENMLVAVNNLGYLHARVNQKRVVKGKKVRLTYEIVPGERYRVRNIRYLIEDSVVERIVREHAALSSLQPGMPFDLNVLDGERSRISSRLQNSGYYKFNKEYISYTADTVRNTYQVDVTMHLAPFRQHNDDSPQNHRQYYINKVNFITDYNVLESSALSSIEINDSVHYKGFPIYYKDKLYLRPKVLTNNLSIVPGSLYNEPDVQRTYSTFGRLQALKYTNIRFFETQVGDTAKLNAYVMLTKSKYQSVSFELEGTNSAGDLGAAASVSFQNRNMFKGSETFMIKLRGAYEAVSGLQGGYNHEDYTELGAEATINFPRFLFPFLSNDFRRKIRATTEFGVQYNYQIRPEFSRIIASANWSYKWGLQRQRAQHRIDLLDINYLYMPSISQEFRDKYLNNEQNYILKYNYDDRLIVRTGYSYTYNSAGQALMNNAIIGNSYSIRFNFESAGNLLYAFARMTNMKKNEDGEYSLLSIPFAQYVKGDFDFAKNIVIDNRNSIAFHVGAGIAVPYGNATIVPFEKRYFSGGANSVRGWSVRDLGPGVFPGDGNFMNQSGDVKLDASIEYRTRLFWKFRGAVFVDAGNIWTLRDYKDQPGGKFEFNKFYKQIAVAYGLGLRLDLDFFVLRFDGGMKAVNPVYNTKKEHFPIIHPKFSRDFAFHFAVGYPF